MMDIDCFNFKTHLPLILTTIAKSRFVAFDLELSGIPSRQTNRPRGQQNDDSGKQTLQQRYSETKAAAERFQILQIGLTCVEEDNDSGTAFWVASTRHHTERSRKICDASFQSHFEPFDRQASQA